MSSLRHYLDKSVQENINSIISAPLAGPNFPYQANKINYYYMFYITAYSNRPE